MIMKIGDLRKKKCIPCKADIPRLTEGQVAQYRTLLKGNWQVIDSKKIAKEFTFRDFKGAIVFVDNVAEIAEEEGHHPDIHIFYNKVTIELWTHAIAGLSENDFIVARKIEELS